METQKQKILNILSDLNYHCVNEFIDTYCVDYRRRLIDIKRSGYELENRRCERHNHTGGSKEWRLIQKKSLGVILPPQKQVRLFQPSYVSD